MKSTGKAACVLFATATTLACAFATAEPELCAAFSDDLARLDCYDSYYGISQTGHGVGDLPVTADDRLPDPNQTEPASTGLDDLAGPSGATTPSPIMTRNQQEIALADRRFSITPHRPNYILPATYNTSSDYSVYGTFDDAFSNAEVKFQLSLKTLLARDLWRGSSVWAGYTQQSYWQLYADDVASSPFRETNYQPEVFWEVPVDFGAFGWRARTAVVALNHQSNGQIDGLSRSWNRVTAELTLDNGPFAASVKTWTRLEEDPDNDDNPNIEEFMGRMQLGLAYKRGDNLYSLRVINNLSGDSRSGVELHWSFPLLHRLKGFVQVYSGYGENMIDMENNTHRIGFGIALSDWL